MMTLETLSYTLDCDDIHAPPFYACNQRILCGRSAASDIMSEEVLSMGPGP